MPTLRRMGPLEAVSEAVNKVLPGHRPSKMGKLLKNVEKLPQVEWAQNLMDYLLKKDDFTIVEKSLEGLEGSNIPALSPYRIEDRATSVRITVALEALRDLQPLLVAIDSAPESHALEAYSEKCWGMVTEAWNGVLKWLAFLLADASGFTNSRLVVSSCSYLLLIVTSNNKKGQQFKEQMMSNPGTLQVVRSLICQVDPRTKSHYNLAHTPETGAIDIQMLEFCTARQVSLTNFRALLRAHPNTQREPMVKMFFKRAEEMQTKIGSMSAASLCGSIQDLARLCAVLSQLFGDYQFRPAPRHRKILSVYPALLSKWCEKAHGQKIKDAEVWANVAECIGYLVLLATRMKFNCSSAVMSLVEGGILPCIARCTPHVSIPLAKTALRAILAYLHPRKIFDAALAREDDKLWDSPKTIPGDQEDSVYHDYRAFFQWRKGCLSPSTDRPLNMCSNRKHATSTRSGNEDTTPNLKTCSRCHAVAYCSVECQREDWLDLHSDTCPALTRTHNDTRTDHAWPSLDTRRDQLGLLESFANANFPSPVELADNFDPIRQGSPSNLTTSPRAPPTPLLPQPKRHVHLDQRVILDFFTGDEARMLCYGPRSKTLVSRMDMRSDSKQSEIRDRLFRVLERRGEGGSETVAFVEAKFRLNGRYESLVIAELYFDASAPPEERYRVVHSYHWIILTTGRDFVGKL